MISYLASSKRYGAPKIHKDLLEKGYQISEKRVQKLMTELNIRSIVRKKYRPASLSKQEAKEYPDLLNRDFSTDKINQKWVTDITYIYTLSDGWRRTNNYLQISKIITPPSASFKQPRLYYSHPNKYY